MCLLLHTLASGNTPGLILGWAYSWVVWRCGLGVDALRIPGHFGAEQSAWAHSWVH